MIIRESTSHLPANGTMFELTTYSRLLSRADTSSKSFSMSTSPSICGEEGVGFATGVGLPGESCSQFIPTQNWPVLLVKGEIDPAIITGTIRYAGYNQSLYSQPVGEAGRVDAKMTTRLDPYTGQARPDLPTVDAVGYFNATAHGHYEVEGLAPGVYDLYASAAGYPQTLIESGFTVLKGQSLHFDGYLQPGPVIHGNVFTKHQFGDEPWPYGDTGINCPDGSTDCTAGTDITGQYMKIELYDAPTLNHVPDPSANYGFMVAAAMRCWRTGILYWYVHGRCMQ